MAAPFDFTIRVVTPAGVVRVITRDEIAASIEAAGYVAAVGLQQLEFVIDRALNPPPPRPAIVPPPPPAPPSTPTPGADTTPKEVA